MRQKNFQTIFYHLIVKDVKVKEDILNRQKLCKKFDQMTLEIQKKSEKVNSIELSNDEAQIDELLSKEKLQSENIDFNISKHILYLINLV